MGIEGCLRIKFDSTPAFILGSAHAKLILHEYHLRNIDRNLSRSTVLRLVDKLAFEQGSAYHGNGPTAEIDY